jgi:WD40 repeat protein
MAQTRFLAWTEIGFTTNQTIRARNWIAAADLQGHAGKVLCAALSKDGKHLATGRRDYTAKIWDVEKCLAGQ